MGFGAGAGCGGTATFFPSFIIFLILILLVFGTGFLGFGGGAYEVEKQHKVFDAQSSGRISIGKKSDA